MIVNSEVVRQAEEAKKVIERLELQKAKLAAIVHVQDAAQAARQKQKFLERDPMYQKKQQQQEMASPKRKELEAKWEARRQAILEEEKQKERIIKEKMALIKAKKAKEKAEKQTKLKQMSAGMRQSRKGSAAPNEIIDSPRSVIPKPITRRDAQPKLVVEEPLHVMHHDTGNGSEWDDTDSDTCSTCSNSSCSSSGSSSSNSSSSSGTSASSSWTAASSFEGCSVESGLGGSGCSHHSSNSCQFTDNGTFQPAIESEELELHDLLLQFDEEESDNFEVFADSASNLRDSQSSLLYNY